MFLSTQFRDKNNRPAQMVRFAKKVNGTYYVVEATPDSADRKLHIASAYIQNNGGSITQELNMDGIPSPQPTPEAPLGPVASAGTTLAQQEPVVNGDSFRAESTVEEQSIETEIAADAEPASAREGLPQKAKDYLTRAENKLLREIGKAMSVPTVVQRTYLKDIVREISAEYLANGKISRETVNRLFERAYKEGMVEDRTFYDDNKHIRKYLRETPVSLSKEDRADIADFDEWRDGARGLLRISDKDGLPVDTVYEQLNEMDGELFPADITHPADRLQRMKEVAESIRVIKQNLDEFYGPEHKRTVPLCSRPIVFVFPLCSWDSKSPALSPASGRDIMSKI